MSNQATTVEKNGKTECKSITVGCKHEVLILASDSGQTEDARQEKRRLTPAVRQRDIRYGTPRPTKEGRVRGMH